MSAAEVLWEGEATCVLEPRGAAGLEGYMRGVVYRFQKCRREGAVYYRVFPSAVFSEFYETCGPNVFSKFFEVVLPGAPDDDFTFLPSGVKGEIIRQCNDCGAYAFDEEAVTHFPNCKLVRA